MNEVERFCATVRDSFPGAELVYTRGGCWAFFVMLRFAFPSAIPLYDDDIGHVYSKIDGHVYDINGKRLRGEAGLIPMARPAIEDAHRWAPRALGQLASVIALHLRVPVEVTYDA